MGVVKLARAAPAPLSEPRTKLAAAIADLRTAEDRLAGIQAALNGENGKVSISALCLAEAFLTKASEDLATAQKAAGEFLLRDALGTAEGDAPDLKAARAAVAEATDQVAAIRAARAALGDELQPAKYDVEMCNYNLTAAVRAVVKDESQSIIVAAIEEIEALQVRLVAKHLALETLLFESETRAIGASAQPNLAEVTGRADYPLRSWRCTHVRGGNDPSPARTAWQAAVRALRTDPTARLPETI